MGFSDSVEFHIYKLGLFLVNSTSGSVKVLHFACKLTYLSEAGQGVLGALLLLISSSILQGIDCPVCVLYPFILHHHSLASKHLKQEKSMSVLGG